MDKFKVWLSGVTALLLISAFVGFCVGANIWVIKWILSLLGV